MYVYYDYAHLNHKVHQNVSTDTLYGLEWSVVTFNVEFTIVTYMYMVHIGYWM